MDIKLRISSLLLVMILLVGALCLPAATAETPVSRNILSIESLSDLAVFEGKLYGIGWEGCYRIDTDTGEMASLGRFAAGAEADQRQISRLFSDEQSLLCLDESDMMLYRADIEAGTASLTPLATLSQWTEHYMTALDYCAPFLYAYGGDRVHRFNLNTEEYMALDAGQVRDIAVYRDGLLLAVESRKTADGWTSALYTYDFDAGEKTLLGEPAGDLGYALAYDAPSDTVYTADSSALYAWQPDQQETVMIAPIPRGDAWALTLLPDGRAAVIIDGDFLALRPLTPGSFLAKSLTLLMPFGRASDYMAFYREHPEIDLVFRAPDAGASVEECFINDMLTRSQEVDIYLMSDQNLLSSIKQKGFALPLSQSPVIKKAVDAMEAPFREALSLDGEIYAVPQEVFLNLTAYNTDAFEQLQLQPPTTYAEYYDLCLRWFTELAEDHPEYRFDPFDNGMDLVGLLARIAGELARNGQPLNFDTPAIRDLVERVAQVARLEIPDNHDATEWLFYQYYLPTLPEYAAYLPLRLEAGNKLALPVGPDDFKYLVINPYSDHAEAALLLLSSVMQNLDGCYNIVLDSSMNQPVENPYFDEQLADFDSRRASLQAAADAAEGAEKTALEESLKAFDAEREQFIQESRWWFDQDAVARSRQSAPDACIPAFNPIWRLAEEYPALFDEYRTNPGFNPENFLKQLNSMVATALAEQE
ncbi:MAG: hypothetical protein ACOX63_13025 [Christensenellales bacterium]|jgi:hypothetical protein